MAVAKPTLRRDEGSVVSLSGSPPTLTGDSTPG